MVIYDEQAIPYIVEGLLKGTSKNTEETKGENGLGLFGSIDANNKIKVYVFSPGRYAFDDDFYEVQDKVQLVALPAAIYDAYQRVLPRQKERLLETEATETPVGTAGHDLLSLSQSESDESSSSPSSPQLELEM